MSRSMWNGAIAFGAVTVPIKVFLAAEPRSLGFRELHVADAAPIAHRHIDADSGEQLAPEEVVRGAELASGGWVILSPEELKAVEQPRRRAVEIESFVAEADVDPIYYDRAYNLAPQEAGREGYAVLLAALKRTGRCGIGRVVLRARERLVIVRAAGQLMRMHTMRFQGELAPAGSLHIEGPERKPTKAELKIAKTLVDQLAGQFEPGRLHDSYRERVLRLAQSKKRGERQKQTHTKPPQPTDDLLHALKASVAGSQ